MPQTFWKQIVDKMTKKSQQMSKFIHSHDLS